MGRTCLGIDLGTSFLKGAVLDLDELRLSHTERLPFPACIKGLPPAHYEVDPQQVISAVQELIRHLLNYAPECQGLVMCTQMHGLVLTDRLGRPYTNIITWQDQRTLERHPSGKGTYYDVLSTQVSQLERQESGNDLWASRPLSVLFWMHEQTDTTGNALSRTELFPVSLPDFVLSNLCQVPPTTDLTNAAAYGAFNVRQKEWHHAVIGRLGLDEYQWPSIRPAGDVVGSLNMDGHRLACYTPIGDHQCAVLGTLLQSDELSINISTGSQVGMVTSDFAPGSNYQVRPYFDDKYLKAVIHIPAGRALNDLIHLLMEIPTAQGIEIRDPWAYIQQATADRPPTDLKVNLAFFPSSCGDTGSISNIHEDNLNVASLFLAAYENMASNYLECAQRISPVSDWKRLVFSGGLVQKLQPLQTAILRQFRCDYRYAPSTEDTLLGLLVFALASAGCVGSVEQARNLVVSSLLLS